MMFLSLLNLVKDMLMFTGSYSNQVFPEPLSSVEEEEMINQMLNGSREARNQLIEHNLRLVAHIVKKFDNGKYDTDDLISIGTIGLIKGIDSYQKSRATKITTYAARCIENEILMHFRSDKKNNKNISIDEPVGFDKEGNVITFLDVLKTPKPDFALDIHLQNNLNSLKKYFKVLTPREKNIITKRYGLDGNDEITQKEIASELGISRSYVSRIEKRALTKILKEFIKNKEN